MNDDVTEVRRLLAPADPAPRGTFTGAAHDPAGRAAYTRVITSGRAAAPRRRRPRTSVRLVAAAGLALALAAGVTVAQDLGGTDETGRPPRTGVAVGPADGPQVVLVRAAESVQARPFTAPRPDQWIFNETRYWRAAASGKVKRLTDRAWTRADGRSVAVFEKGRLVLSPTGGGMPPTDYASVSRLPRDPDALLAWARKELSPIPGGPDARAFTLLFSLLLNNAVLPPDQEKAVYRALAKIPRITLDRSAVDGAGAPVVSIALVSEGYLKQEVLLDRTSFAYRGHRTTVIKDHRFEEGHTYRKGTVESQSIRLARGVVDKPGVRP